MLNFRSVSIKGAFNFGRARVLWHAGVLRVFDINGLALEVVSSKPVPKKGYRRAWDAKTVRGDVIMRGKCMTCGGRRWWRVTYASDNELWNMT